VEKICKRRNRRKRKDVKRGEEVGKRQNKMEKLDISPILRKEQHEMMGAWMTNRRSQRLISTPAYSLTTDSERASH
jgi:hypothetical protein